MIHSMINNQVIDFCVTLVTDSVTKNNIWFNIQSSLLFPAMTTKLQVIVTLVTISVTIIKACSVYGIYLLIKGIEYDK